MSIILNDTAAAIESNGNFEDWAEGIKLYESAVAPLSPAQLNRVKDTLAR